MSQWVQGSRARSGEDLFIDLSCRRGHGAQRHPRLGSRAAAGHLFLGMMFVLTQKRKRNDDYRSLRTHAIVHLMKCT